MSDPSAENFLEAWEQSAAQPKALRPAAFLQNAYFVNSPGKVSDMTIGEYDAQMLLLRERLFGGNLSATATCPDCGEKLELAFTVSDLRPTDASPPANTTGQVQRDGYTVGYRLPKVADLQAATAARDFGHAKRILIARCVTSAHSTGREVDSGELPEDVVTRLATAMSEADPRAGPELTLSCPKCSHSWAEPFDAGSFVWSEVQAWAQNVLGEIHILASSYGWTEQEILALSPSRRRTYVEMAQG